MRIEKVNLGKAKPIESGGETYDTGIFKEAATGVVEVGELGLTGDTICDAKYHGGVDQAVYLYSIEDYAFWSSTIGEDLEPGCFGENLTTSGCDLTTLNVGDQIHLPNLLLQVSAPRIPCNTLESRVGVRGFAKQFMREARSGAYCRVLKTGTVEAGQEFTVKPYDGERLLLTTFFKDVSRKLTEEEMQFYLSLPIDERTRADIEQDLAKQN